MAEGGFTLDSQFVLFAIFNCDRSDGTKITLRQLDRWFLQAEVLDGKRITYTDTGVLFNKHKSRTISYDKFLIFLEELANAKQMDIEAVKVKLTECGIPGAEKTKAHKPSNA